MSDPRIVEPQRVTATTPDACGARYWCARRITATVGAGLLLLAVGVAGWWWGR